MNQNQLNQWIYVALQIRDTGPIEKALIIDGKEFSYGRLGEGIFSDTSDPIFIGGKPGYESLVGLINEVRISKGWRYLVPSVFSPEKRFKTDEKTLALWHFDEGPDATRFADSSGNGYTLIRVRAFSVNQKQRLTITWGQLKK